MAATEMSSRLAPYAQELLDNEYARENLRAGAEKLRAAYGRSQRRRVKSSRDKKLRRQVGTASSLIVEGGRALASGRRKPEKRRGRWLLVLLGLGAIGAGVAVASNEELRASLFGSDQSPSPSADGTGS
jgi:hypothetical protein